MKISEIKDFKAWLNDEIQQAKPYHKRIKRLTLYKNNQPVKLNRKNQ